MFLWGKILPRFHRTTNTETPSEEAVTCSWSVKNPNLCNASVETMISDRSLRVYEGLLHIMGCIRRCSGTTREWHRASKRRSRGNAHGTSNDYGKVLQPGKVIPKILVLLLMFAAFAEVHSQPSSPNGSTSDGLRISLKSTETSVKVEWTMHDPNVRDFMVTLREDTFIREITYIDAASASKTDFVDLMPCFAYHVTVQPLDADGNKIGHGQSKSTSTAIAAPPAVTGLSGQSSAESITLTWKRPSTACEITAYTITYQGVVKWGPRTGHTGSTIIDRRDVNGTTTAVIDGLQPYTDYTVMVTASSDKGAGEPTLFNTTTKDAAPEKPTNLVMLQSTASTVSLIWKEPYELKGELKEYEVSCYAGATRVLTEVTDHPVHIIGGLSACTEYTVHVAASTAGGKGNSTNITVVTPAEPSPPVTDFFVRNFTSRSINLTWKRPETVCEITAYNITCTEVAKTKARTKLHKLSTLIGRRDANDSTSITINDLQPNTDYIVTATASTEAGEGTGAKIDFVAARTRASQEPNVAPKQESNSIRFGPSTTLIVSVMVSVHVYKCLHV